jgi:uncharacterized protein
VFDPYLLDGPLTVAWWPALQSLDQALAASDAGAVARNHAAVARALVVEGRADLAEAVADAVLYGQGSWSTHVGRAIERRSAPLAAPGVAAAAADDLTRLAALVRRDWQGASQALLGRLLPAWQALAGDAGRGAAADAAVQRLRAALLAARPDDALAVVEEAARVAGAGPLARHEAFAWDGARLQGVPVPAAARLEDLHGLERQLEPLLANVEAFLAGKPALATLLYGPRGSGKSTTVRALLERYASRGLRLVEVPPARVAGLVQVLHAVAQLPRPVVLMLDDLAFDDGDERLRPLKSLLEGSLLTRHERVLVVATSNRRHLVRERHGDRPDPSDADVHAWDTHHERLALADRFGLTITFPSADRRGYLGIVRALAAAAGVPVDAGLEARAQRFAAWGNGYSGRTARQFVDRERAELPEPLGP